MRWLLLLLLGTPLLPYSSSAPAPKAPELCLELRLRATNSKVKLGQPVRWEVVLVNRGKQAVTLVQPGDGSKCGWRTPIIEWVVDGKVPGAIEMLVEKVKKGEKDAPAAKPELLPACLTGRAMRIARCGNINRLKASDVFDLAPGKEIKLSEWIGTPSFGDGTHKVAVRYFNIPMLKWRGLPLGKHDEKAMERIKSSSPRVTLESNTVEITVQE
jgi:hypothetical protein